MKVLVLTLLAIIAVTFAIPVEMDSGDESQLTLVDLDNDQPSDEINAPEGARSKRFILKKIALAKAGVLGLGALGLAGAVAAKSGGSFLGGGNQISQGYGPSYGYNSYNSYSGYNSIPTTAYPAPTYYTSQSYVPQQTYAPVQPQPVYGPPQPSFNPINQALAWKAGIASNLAGAVGFNTNQIQPAPISYSYGAPPVPSGPVPNKPLYVVCDNN